MDQIYQYVGDGLGVPGLPHKISRKEAERLGVLDILEAAIENGNYVELQDALQESD
jgi:hypothetical protein